jgi:hypothetical protein
MRIYLEETRMTHLSFFAVTCFVLSSVVSPGILAQSKPASVTTFEGGEQGSFKIFFSGEVIGFEKYQIAPEGGNFKAVADVRLVLERGSEKVAFNLRPVLQFSKEFEPRAYQIIQESGANRMKARISFRPGKSEAVFETGKEADTREIELKKDVVILDDNVFHHYLLLVRRYDFSKGGVQEFSAFVPQQFTSGGISVEDKGFEQVSIGGKTSSLQHLLVDTGELQISLWLTESHQLQKISVPKSNVDVLRE